MNINGTILVQAFNFFVVYWMLRLLLFKPIITIIQHENAETQAMLDIIDQQQKSLAIQEKERQRHWYICQEYFTIHQPYRPSDHFLIADTTEDLAIPTDQLPAQDIAEILIDVRKKVEETIKHVH